MFYTYTYSLSYLANITQDYHFSYDRFNIILHYIFLRELWQLYHRILIEFLTLKCIEKFHAVFNCNSNSLRGIDFFY